MFGFTSLNRLHYKAGLFASSHHFKAAIGPDPTELKPGVLYLCLTLPTTSHRISQSSEITARLGDGLGVSMMDYSYGWEKR